MTKLHRGLAPKKSMVSEMRRRGYALAEELAKKHGISISALYTWNRKGQLPRPAGIGDEFAVSVKLGGNRWFLIASVDAKMALPAVAR
jgi:predicted DNA-binding transcriptional regulator AlpA